jgi:hypothetical protein
MNVTMFHPHGNHIHRDLSIESCQNQHSQPKIAPGDIAVVRMVQLRQKVQKRQAEQIRPGKCVEQLDMLRLIETKEEDTEGAEDDAREEKEIIHGAACAANCKSFAFSFQKNARDGSHGLENDGYFISNI